MFQCCVSSRNLEVEVYQDDMNFFNVCKKVAVTRLI